MTLTQEQKTHFWDEGYLPYQRVLSDEEVMALKQRSEEIAMGQGNHVPESFIQIEPAVHRGEATVDSRLNSIRKMTHLTYFDPLFHAVAMKPAIVDAIEDLLGPDLKLYTDQLMMKPPMVGSRLGWHQDSAAWMFFIPHNHISCWIALDDSTIENGCMRVIAGSHRYGILDSKRLPYFLTEEQLARETPIPLPAGSCMFHHSLTLHGSHANTTPNRRRGLALHYMEAQTRYLGAPEEHPTGFMRIRGREFAGCV